MYLLVGMVWVGMSLRFLPLLGLSVRDDVLERKNAGVSYAAAGAMLAVMLCYAGGNIGDGPGWWVVVFSAALATGGLLIAWQLFATVTTGTDAVTIDRDPAAGMRLACFLVACGLVLGRSVAGDWQSVDATLRDFASMVPFVAILVVLAVIVEPLGR